MIQPEIIEAYEAWWEHRNDEPVIAFPYDKPEVDVSAAWKPWMQDKVEPLWALCNAVDVMAREGTDDPGYIDDAIDYLERSIDAQDFLGAGVHSRPFMLGPGSIAASIRGYFQFLGNSVWFEKEEEPLPYEDLPEAPPEPPNRFDELSFMAANRLAERLGGKLVIGHADLGGILDILAALRTTNELLVDTLDEEAAVIDAACRKIEAVWRARYAGYDRIFAGANGGLRSSWMPIPSKKTYFPLQNDFGAMISPAMFEAFLKAASGAG